MKKVSVSLLIIVVMMSFVLSFVACDTIPRSVPRDVKFDESGYEVTFMDDFDGGAVDYTRWRAFNGNLDLETLPQYVDHNYRASYYSNDDDIIYVDDGALHIATKYKNGRYGEGWYTGWLESSTGDSIRDFESYSENYTGFAQKYGYFEIKCIAPPAEGMWSAFWLLPDEGVAFSEDDVMGSAVDGAEIDVMESQNYFKKKSFCQHVVHADYHNGGGGDLKSDASPIYDVKDMYTEYHTYGVEWTPELITFYIDGYKTYETKVVVDGNELGIPDVEKFLILSIETAGYADENGVHVGVEKDGKKCWLGSLENMDKNKSYDFIVDYVKVMKKK